MFPNFGADFVLETDASTQGLGAVLSKTQSSDGKLHPTAYASRALNASERKYGITELEILAVVWGISHFHHYLYGNQVTVLTDHTAVKAVLETDNPSPKHACWWTRVYGRGVRSVTIQYRAGWENKNADALSRSPCRPAPAIGIAEDEIQVSTLTTVPGKDTQSIATIVGSASTASTCAQQDGTISLKEWPTEELKTHDESGMADVGTDTISVAEQPTHQMSASETVSCLK